MLSEARDLAAEVMRQGKLDWLDLSLWDARKMPVEAAHAHKPLFSWFTDLPRHGVRLGVCGKIVSPATALELVNAGADFVFIGRTAILHHDWPARARGDAAFEPAALPVSPAYLEAQGVGPRFIRYLRTFENFVSG